jgi:hypothetical protein
MRWGTRPSRLQLVVASILEESNPNACSEICPNGRAAGTKTPRPPRRSVLPTARVYCLTECLAVTCPISCACARTSPNADVHVRNLPSRSQIFRERCDTGASAARAPVSRARSTVGDHLGSLCGCGEWKNTCGGGPDSTPRSTRCRTSETARRTAVPSVASRCIGLRQPCKTLIYSRGAPAEWSRPSRMSMRIDVRTATPAKSVHSAEAMRLWRGPTARDRRTIT